MLFPHYVGHGTYLLQRKANMHFSHTRNSALTHFFLIMMDYLTSLIYRLLCGETDKAASSTRYHPLYTNYRTHEYIMAAILWSSWECRKYFGHVTRHSTPEVSIPALGTFLYVFSDFVINLHSSHTETHHVQIYLEQSQSIITLRNMLNIVAIQSELMNIKQIKT